MASGDLRESANVKCWPAQQDMEQKLAAAAATLGARVEQGQCRDDDGRLRVFAGRRRDVDFGHHAAAQALGRCNFNLDFEGAGRVISLGADAGYAAGPLRAVDPDLRRVSDADARGVVRCNGRADDDPRTGFAEHEHGCASGDSLRRLSGAAQDHAIGGRRENGRVARALNSEARAFQPRFGDEAAFEQFLSAREIAFGVGARERGFIDVRARAGSA